MSCEAGHHWGHLRLPCSHRASCHSKRTAWLLDRTQGTPALSWPLHFWLSWRPSLDFLNRSYVPSKKRVIRGGVVLTGTRVAGKQVEQTEGLSATVTPGKDGRQEQGCLLGHACWAVHAHSGAGGVWASAVFLGERHRFEHLTSWSPGTRKVGPSLRSSFPSL